MSTQHDNADFARAVETARYHQAHFASESCVIHHVSEWGPNGAHYEPGYRVFPVQPQAPGGMLPPSTDRPGMAVAIVDPSGRVCMTASTESVQHSDWCAGAFFRDHSRCDCGGLARKAMVQLMERHPGEYAAICADLAKRDQS